MAKETTVEVKTTKVETKYSIEDFLNNCEALGYKREVVAGALFNSKEKEFTKSEFQEKVKEFLGKKVQ
ncbi:hypothetical protein [Clostridium senegalense]|uniref:hypothetical protein n=1 Tax=Clostridium senegalense TaxID=1465809 RepID=UPI000288C943|nr:hypothetical protein [Clostridium senegalense]